MEFESLNGLMFQVMTELSQNENFLAIKFFIIFGF